MCENVLFLPAFARRHGSRFPQIESGLVFNPLQYIMLTLRISF